MKVCHGYKLTTLIVLVLSISSCSKKDEPATTGPVVSGETAAKVDTYLTRITPFGYSGAALVAKGGQIILNKGYGMADAAAGIANTHETVFSVGSITKQFTATAIMKLEMMGRLSTGDSLPMYFGDVPEEKRGITLHHLLTHTSGVINSTGHDFEQVGRDTVVSRVLKAPLQFDPGYQFSYSNAGYSLLAAVVEIASGQSYEEILREHLFQPAGMNFTGYRLPDWSAKVVARWYDELADNGTPLERAYPFWNYIGNGGILSTTGDMFRWHQALMGDQILSAEAKGKLYTTFLNDYAYGWDVLETDYGTLIQHDGGSSLGCAADIKRYVDSNVVIMLFSNATGTSILMDQGVRDKVARLVFGAEITLPWEAAQSAGDLTGLEGNYRVGTSDLISVLRSGERLTIAPFGVESAKAFYFPGDSMQAVIDANETRSNEILNAAIKDDFEPMRKLVNDDQRLERIKEFWYVRKQQYSGMTGELKEARVVYSAPSGFEPDAAQTVMEVLCERKSLFFRLIWKDGEMIGIGPTQPTGMPSAKMVPLDGHQAFFTYDIAAAKNIRVEFVRDNRTGSVNLVIGEGAHTTTATR